MHNNIETIAKIVQKAKSILNGAEVVVNEETKVSVILEEDGEGTKIYRVIDQTSIIRKKKARIVIYSDGDFHCEYNGFKSEEEILQSLEK